VEKRQPNSGREELVFTFRRWMEC